MTSVQMQPTRPVRGLIRPPGSKSITNRALICAALASGQSGLRGALDSEDTRVMLDSLAKLGVETNKGDDDLITVLGCDGLSPADLALWIRRLPGRRPGLWKWKSGVPWCQC